MQAGKSEKASVTLGGPARRNWRVDICALVAGVLVFATGLVLFFEFHVGPGGITRVEGLGLSRLAWVNLHRLSALILMGAQAFHVALHEQAIRRRLGRLTRPEATMSRSDPFLYFGFLTVVLAGLAAWLVLPGSPPLGGPAGGPPPPTARHRAIDIHNLAGFVTLLATAIHVRRRAGWLVRQARLPEKTTRTA